MAPLLAIAFSGAGAQVAAQGVPQRPSAPGSVPRTVQQSISQPVVQPLPSSDGMTLNAALGRLARDPRDIAALIDAGNAALTMGDVDAATGFFRRADQVSPGNPRVKAGLAGAMVRNGDPFGAIPLFDEAEKAGAMDAALAADRGLAYDLVGDNATAQRLYRQGLARVPSDEAVRRLALSLAISGDKHGAELILSPLLQQRNLAAWRTRVFVLAILGQTEEAVSIANTILPSELAAGIAPYLRYMPRLTHAQQAAAANFGLFPRASDIGRDDPRVALYAPKRVAAVDAALIPQGEPLGRKGRGRDRDRNRASRSQSAALSPAPATGLPGAAGASEAKGVRIAPPEPPQPAREVTTAAAALPAIVARPAPPVAMAPAPVRVSPPSPASAPPAAAAQVALAPVTKPAGTAPGMLPVQPGFSIAPAAPAPAPSAPPPLAASAAPPPAAPVSPPPAQPVAKPAPVAAPAPPAPAKVSPAAPRSLADVFADFAQPTIDATPAAGAVDLRRIKPARPEAKKPAEAAKPPPPSHPSRIWVQVATGRDKAALGYDWRRMSREKAEVLRGKAAFVSAWGQTNRLLTGPFQSEAAANSFIAQLRRADVNGAFVWTSPAGQVVDTLAAAGTEADPPQARRGSERSARGTDRSARPAERSTRSTDRKARSGKGR